MQVASATTLTPNFLKNIPANRERFPKSFIHSPKNYHFPHSLRCLNPYIIQIAQKRSNPVLRGMQSWKVKQISNYAASSLSASKGVANDLFFGKTGKSSNMKAWLREEKSSTPITASTLLARIHNPASRGNPMTFQLPYAPQGQKDRCMLSACYFISWERENWRGRLSQKFFWNIIGTKSFPRRKWFRFQNFLGLRTACKLCFSPAHHHYHLQCHHNFKKTFKTQEIRIK